ncbi:helix-turn-helix domain-containing protein [Micromonospora sp. NBC_01813]|uniref:helix-turn-helix domain-containing protein n=1 Tax=Micromonospora sp. NBC_01813 TaxID=2975988 RepID=UPI002DD8DF04|nr:helix-turn-helix domain-containing protein [Micromonospora sp. NBC_01813]WSA06154.1 helix-turn-helix domain-containing protein [Micromonospora sp. NBC_01813]
MATIGDHIARLRIKRGLTQEGLAEAAEVSVDTIRKLESNGRNSARLSTLHQIARALSVPTTALVGDASAAAARREPDHSPLSLLALRRALTPVRGTDGAVVDAAAEPNPPTLDSARESVRVANTLYHASDYSTALRILPDLLAEARVMADSLSSGPAHAVACEAYQLAARLLIQIRAHDLAYVAVAEATRRATEAGDDLVSASVVGPACWLLLRQARLTEAGALATSAADAMEPSRLSRAEPARVAAWGWLLIEAAAAAARDSRPDDASEMLDLAAAAAVRVGRQPVSTGLPMVDGFSSGRVDTMRAEAAAIDGRPDEVLRLAARLRLDGMHPSCRHRHRLDVAWAYATRGNHAEAVSVLGELRSQAPDWLRHQRYAQDIVDQISAARRRAVGGELAALEALFNAN